MIQLIVFGVAGYLGWKGRRFIEVTGLLALLLTALAVHMYFEASSEIEAGLPGASWGAAGENYIRAAAFSIGFTIAAFWLGRRLARRKRGPSSLPPPPTVPGSS